MRVAGGAFRQFCYMGLLMTLLPFLPQAQAPTISSFTPTSGAAGTLVSITGTNLTGTTAVRFAGALAKGVTVVSATKVQARVPVGAGTGTVSVTKSIGTATSTASFTYIASYQTMDLSGFTADVVANGTGVSASTTTTAAFDNANWALLEKGFNNGTTTATRGLPQGGNFSSAVTPNLYYQLDPYTGNNSLRLGAGASGTLTLATPVAAKQLYVLAATGGGQSTVNITVTFTDNTTQVFTAQKINDWFGGANAAINGLGRADRTSTYIEQNTVDPRLYETKLALNVANMSKLVRRISFTTASSPTSTGVLNVMAVSRRVPAAPVISSFTPTSAGIGVSVTITGTDLDDLTGLTLNGVAVPLANVTGNTATRLTFVVPVGATSGQLRVTTVLGTSPNSSQTLTIVPNPTISSLSPTSGPVGTSVTITGTGLTGIKSVSFGEVPAVGFSVNATGTQLTARVPRLASSQPIRLNKPGGTVLSAAKFVVTRALASYDYSLSTASFSGIDVGSYATPTVSDLDGNGRLDLLIGNDAGELSHYEQAAANSLNFTLVSASFSGIDVGDFATPAVSDLDGDGLLDLLIGNDAGELSHYEQAAANSLDFVLVSAIFSGINMSFGVTPMVSDLDGDGLLDLLVSISNGSVRHYEQTAANSLSFALFTNDFGLEMEYGSSPSPIVSDLNGDGRLDLLVGNRRGTLSHYVQGPTPILYSITPTSGPVGTVVTLNGNYLKSTTAVHFNGAAAISFNVTYGLTIKTTVPAGATTGNVTVTTPGGTSNGVAFTVTPAPVLTALTPAAELPGQTVTLTGTGFTPASTVTFGGIPASSVTYLSATSLVATVPTGATPGSTAVLVTTSGSTNISSPAFEVLGLYRPTTASPCLSTTPVLVDGTGGAGDWRYLRLPTGQVVAAVENTRNLGTVTAGVLILGTATAQTVRRDGSSQAYLDRNFFLTATNKTFPGQSVRVRFFGLNSELARLQAVDVKATLAGLRASQYSGSNENCNLADNEPAGERRLLAASATVAAGADWFTIEVTVADHFSEFYLTGANSPLPVELVRFTAEAQGVGVALAWATASEKNSAYFEVECSLDGRTFARIGRVAAAGHSSSPRTYAWRDNELAATATTHYYRLRQLDEDGTFSFSPVRAVKTGAAPGLSVYPNPTAGAATLTGAAAGTAVQVYDAQGRRVLSTRTDATGQALLQLPTDQPAGIYLVRCGAQVVRLSVQ